MPLSEEKALAISNRDREIIELAKENSDEIMRNYLLKRLIPQMQWLSKTAKKNQKKYYALMTCSIAISAMIPVASIFSTEDKMISMIVALMGAIVTFINAYIMLFDAKNVWVNCRDVRENLNSFFYQYYCCTGTFEDCSDQAERNKRMVELCEDALNNEVQRRMNRFRASD